MSLDKVLAEPAMQKGDDERRPAGDFETHLLV